MIFTHKSGHLRSAGNIVGYLSRLRQDWAFSVALSQGTDGRWRIATMVQLHPAAVWVTDEMTPSRCALALARAAACLAVLIVFALLVL